MWENTQKCSIMYLWINNSLLRRRIAMKLKKRLISLGLCVALVFGSSTFAFADGSRVVTLGANLNEEQKDKMLKYFE